MPIVYCTTNLVNGKIYVGVHKGTNKNYLGSGKCLLYAIKKYGKENFKRETLFECESHEECYWLEKIIVNEWFINQEDNYNLNGGGRGASEIHPDTRKKISKKRKELYKDKEFRKRIAKATRAGQLESIANGTFYRPKGKDNPMYGVPKSKEFVENLRRVKMKPVKLVKDDVVIQHFKSLSAAGEFYNISPDSIKYFITHTPIRNRVFDHNLGKWEWDKKEG